ncbi:extracellular solute-binding protein [Enorma massiliensis]|uniref:ABC transporter substrate-binding protein n=1 Tax=Enorma massiliensis TaxID=1472761 RepID=UPI0019562D36|nr:substrate-binding domain-containing protein [Enorma massiliensis]MBM6783433.1 extracellular solute-binding protein [Enorma massiliensis]MBM6891706.1 extracellular solute-binding protein [Enorma massiliensis]
MLTKPISRRSLLGLSAAGAASLMLGGCSETRSDGKTEVEFVSYKREAVSIFEALMAEFNESNDHIYLNFTSPNDAVTIMKTRFVREDYPDVVAIGGDASYADFVDSNILADMTEYPGMAQVQKAYQDIMKSVTYVPMDGIYGVPYIANAAGMLYNKDMFAEKGWDIPETWDEFIALCEEIKAEGEVLPLYLGFLDTWTILSPWNSILVDLVPQDHIRKVNAGEAKFADYYREPAEKLYQLLQYGEEGPFAYSYEDACTAFARGQSAMFPCGSFAVPQILSANPDMNVGLFAMPAADDPEDRLVVSGVDLCWDMTVANEDHRELVYEVIDFLNEPDNLQAYCDDQKAIPCIEGDFTLDPLFDDIQEFLDAGKVIDYPDHSYPSGMACDARLQAFLMDGDVDAFLENWDSLWQRYNKTVIRKVQEAAQE